MATQGNNEMNGTIRDAFGKTVVVYEGNLVSKCTLCTLRIDQTTNERCANCPVYDGVSVDPSWDCPWGTLVSLRTNGARFVAAVATSIDADDSDGSIDWNNGKGPQYFMSIAR